MAFILNSQAQGVSGKNK